MGAAGHLVRFVVGLTRSTINRLMPSSLFPVNKGAYGGIHPGRVRPASSRHCDVSWASSAPRSPVPAPLHLLVLQLKSTLTLFDVSMLLGLLGGHLVVGLRRRV